VPETINATLEAIEAAIRDPNWVIAASSAVTAFFTIVLGTFTVSLARSTRAAARAAETTAKAAAAIEFPIVRSKWLGPDLEAVDHLIKPGEPCASSFGGPDVPTRFSVISDVEFQNFGRTPAFPIRFAIGHRVVRVLPDEPSYKQSRECRPSSVIGEAQSQNIKAEFSFELGNRQMEMVKNGGTILWVYCQLIYRDVMDQSHEVRCCWKLGRESEEDTGLYLLDDGSAPSAYTART
jgi:hypothetical protein